MVEIPLLAHHHRAAPFTPLATLAAQERVTHPLKMLPDIQQTTDDRLMGFWTQYPKGISDNWHSTPYPTSVLISGLKKKKNVIVIFPPSIGTHCSEHFRGRKRSINAEHFDVFFGSNLAFLHIFAIFPGFDPLKRRRRLSFARKRAISRLNDDF